MCVVLVVEDDDAIRHVMGKALTMHGHDVLLAATICEGMEQLNSAPSHVLSDMNLRDGLGTTILRHIRDGLLPVKVAVVSGTSGRRQRGGGNGDGVRLAQKMAATGTESE